MIPIADHKMLFATLYFFAHYCSSLLCCVLDVCVRFQKLFIESLRKALVGHGSSKQLTESAAITGVKLCKASTYISCEDHSIIFLLVQSIMVDLKVCVSNA